MMRATDASFLLSGDGGVCDASVDTEVAESLRLLVDAHALQLAQSLRIQLHDRIEHLRVQRRDAKPAVQYFSLELILAQRARRADVRDQRP